MKWFKNLFSLFGFTKQNLKLEQKVDSVKHGASFSGYGSKPSFSQLGSLAAFAIHPYVYSAGSRISQDLAALPLQLKSGKGKDTTIIDDHEFLDLLERPSVGTDQFDFIEQLTLDLKCAGNAYILMVGVTEKPTSLIRLHPEQVSILTDQFGVIGYRYDADGKIHDYVADRVVHIKQASWQMGIKGLYGVGAVQPIQQEVRTDNNAAKLVSDLSSKPRPDVIISPKEEGDIWDEETQKEIARNYTNRTSTDSALVTSGQSEITITQTTARDIEFKDARQFSKLAITASFGTPLSVLGEGSANYATARNELLVYWNNVQKIGKKISSKLSSIVKLWDRSLYVEFDYSGIEVFNELRSERIKRATEHIKNGMSAADAYAYEGMADAPISGSFEEETIEESEKNVINYKGLFDFDMKGAEEILEKEYSDLADWLSEEDSVVLEKGSVGDRDPTNFPEDGQNKKVSLSSSNWKTFDPDFAEDLKKSYPKIWGAGGNIEGNNQYRRLYPIATRSDKEATTKTEEMAIRKREAWVARHFEDGKQFKDDPDLSPNISNVAGIVAQIKWLAVGVLGQSEMKRIINELKVKLDEKEENKRIETWNNFIKAKVDPAEKILLQETKKYLAGAAARYQSRIKRNVQKAIVDLSDLQALAEERGILYDTLGNQIDRIWGLVGNQELSRVFRLAKIPKPIDLIFDQDKMFDYIDKSVEEISRTTAEAVTKAVQDGLVNGDSIDQIASNISQIAAFGEGRSQLIARTESARAINLASVSAYQQAEEEADIKVFKEWLTSRDDKARDTHKDLDRTSIPAAEEFNINGATAPCPALFEVPSEDCNCRCTVIPKIIK